MDINIEILRQRLLQKAKAKHHQAKLVWDRAQAEYKDIKRMIRKIDPAMIDFILKEAPDTIPSSGIQSSDKFSLSSETIYSLKDRMEKFIEKQTDQFTNRQVLVAMKREDPNVSEHYIANMLFRLKKEGLIVAVKRGTKYTAAVYRKKEQK